MTQITPPHNLDEIPQAIAEPKRRRSLQLVWMKVILITCQTSSLVGKYNVLP